jgi:hypothetical protein
MKHVIAALTAGGCVLLIASGAAFAGSTRTPTATPTTGQRGAPTNTCGASNPVTPGAAATAQGSPFNTTANGGLGGTAGLNYAGNPGTASLANSNSTATVSQYDVACVELSMP